MHSRRTLPLALAGALCVIWSCGMKQVEPQLVNNLGVSIGPTTAALMEGAAQQFTATVSNDPTGYGVSWAIDEGTLGGVVNETGLYTAPAQSGTFHVRATAKSDGQSSAVAVVSVSSPPGPVISSFTAQPSTIAPGQQTTLSWAVSGASTLSLDNGIGTVTGTSRTISPAASTTYTLSASSAQGTSKKSLSVVVTAQTPGVWVNITPPQISLNFGDFNNSNYGMQTIVAAPSNPRTVYFGTCYQGVWKSTDSGDHFVKINTGTNGGQIDTGRNWTLAVDPTDANVLYTVTGYGDQQGIWKSTNGGVDWAQLMPQSLKGETSADIYSISIDPANHLHLLIGFHSGWNFTGLAGILESTDGGSSWKKIAAGANWGAGHYVFFINSTTWMLTSQWNGMYRTTDSGATWTQVTTQTMQHGGNQLYRASNGVLYTGAYTTLLRSTDNGVSWTAVGPHTSDGYNAIIGDGTSLYAQPANTGSSATGSHSYYVSAETDGVTWTPFNTQMFTDGPMSMSLDGQHQILFSSNWDAGVWRLVTGH